MRHGKTTFVGALFVIAGGVHAYAAGQTTPSNGATPEKFDQTQCALRLRAMGYTGPITSTMTYLCRNSVQPLKADDVQCSGCGRHQIPGADDRLAWTKALIEGTKAQPPRFQDNCNRCGPIPDAFRGCETVEIFGRLQRICP